MTVLEMFSQSGILTLLGMGVVFFFLIIMILAMIALHAVIHALKWDAEPAAEQPVAGVGVGHPAGLDAEAAPRPGGGVGDHIHRAHPAAEQPPTEQQVKNQHDRRADQRR